MNTRAIEQSHREASRLGTRLCARYRVALLAKPEDDAEKARNTALVARMRRVMNRAFDRSRRRLNRLFDALAANGYAR